MRSDAPGRRGGRQVGALPDWTDENDMARALAELDKDAYAASTHGPNASRIRTLFKALGAWGLTPFPPSLAKVRAYAATLKRGRYRSAASYLWIYKGEAERRGFAWSGVLHRAVKDGIRSCERGMGPPTQARPLPLEHLGRLPLAEDPWARGGPPWPRNAIVAGAWWLLREVELSTARAAHVEVEGNWLTPRRL